MAPEESKQCTKCGEFKPLADFSKCSFDPRYKNQNRHRPHCKACRVRDTAGWQRSNVDKKRANHTRWSEANREKVLASSSKYYHANKRKHQALLTRRRARKHGAGGRYTATDVRRIYDAQRGLCYYCGAALNGTYHADHMTPLARGGSNDPSNMCCACPSCNLRKNRRTADEWFRILTGQQTA